MNTKIDPDNRADRLTYLWLALGTILMLLSSGQFRVDLAAWLAPVFLIRFFRAHRLGKGYGLVLLGIYVAMTISWRPILATFFPWLVYLIFILLVAVQYSLPYLADRLLAPRIPGFMATLVYPLAVTTVFFLYNTASPMGSFGTVGYEQYNNLALIQIVSVTGLWGLTFLVSWCGPVVNWAWERSFQWPQIRRGLAVWAGVLGAVLLFGGLRLAFAHTEQGTVQIHSLAVYSDWDALPDMKTDLAGYRQFTQERNEELIQESIRQAQRGAQLVLWSEMAGFGVAEDIDQLVARGREVAQQEDIYLAMGLEIHYPELERPWENKFFLIDPSGENLIDHDKFGATLIYGMIGYGEAVQGEYSLQTVDTPLGKLSGVVCWDADFPITIKQAGQHKADILLVANGDSRSHADLHAQQHIFRAIENGFSLVRQDGNSGYSVAADPYGRILAQVDMLNASDPVMAVQVPTQGVSTIYPIIGDLFAWLAILGFVGSVAWVVYTGRRERVGPPGVEEENPS